MYQLVCARTNIRAKVRVISPSAVKDVDQRMAQAIEGRILITDPAREHDVMR